jgi:hypothetical protein
MIAAFQSLLLGVITVMLVVIVVRMIQQDRARAGRGRRGPVRPPPR